MRIVFCFGSRAPLVPSAIRIHCSANPPPVNSRMMCAYHRVPRCVRADHRRHSCSSSSSCNSALQCACADVPDVVRLCWTTAQQSSQVDCGQDVVGHRCRGEQPLARPRQPLQRNDKISSALQLAGCDSPDDECTACGRHSAAAAAAVDHDNINASRCISAVRRTRNRCHAEAADAAADACWRIGARRKALRPSERRPCGRYAVAGVLRPTPLFALLLMPVLMLMTVASAYGSVVPTASNGIDGLMENDGMLMT